MKLSVAGHPLHTRSLSIASSQASDGRHAIEAAVIDLRKCGFVPVAGFLQASGIVHHMTLEATVDPSNRTLEHFAGAQPTRAFDPSALTAGECCSDPLPRLAALSGVALGESFNATLGQSFGGPLGCSHLVTLAQLLGSGLSTSLDWNDQQEPATRARRVGERIFRRAVEVDGYELDDGRIQVVTQLTDLHHVAAPEIAVPMRSFGAETEVRISAIVDIANGMAMSHILCGERKRTFDDLETAAFVDRSAELEFLTGQNITSGISKRLLEAFPRGSGEGPFRDALLMMAPGFVQCLASLSERWPANAKANPSLLGVCGRPNSCYMWRNDGPVQRAGEEPGAGE